MEQRTKYLRGQTQKGNRPDDVSRFAPRLPSGQSGAGTGINGTSDGRVDTGQGTIIQGVSVELYDALNTAHNVQCYVNSIGTVAVGPITWGNQLSVSILVINDEDPTTSTKNIGVAFGQQNATVPVNNAKMQGAGLVKPGEAIVFPVHTNQMFLIASAASTQVRAFVGLP